MEDCRPDKRQFNGSFFRVPARVGNEQGESRNVSIDRPVPTIEQQEAGNVWQGVDRLV